MILNQIVFKQKQLLYKTSHNSKYGGNVAFWDFLHLQDKCTI